MPSLASTACTWYLADDRIRTSLSRYRVSSRSSRTCGGRTRASASQPRQPQQVGQVGAVPLVVLDPPVGERLDPQRVGQVHLRPGGRQRVRRPVPAVGGLDHHPATRVPARATTVGRRSAAGLLSMRAVSSLRPSSVIRTSTLRCRCRSIPTTCRPSYDSLIEGLLAWWRRMLRNFQHPPGAEARSFMASERYKRGVASTSRHVWRNLGASALGMALLVEPPDLSKKVHMAICITDVETMLTVDERVVATARTLGAASGNVCPPAGQDCGLPGRPPMPVTSQASSWRLPLVQSASKPRLNAVQCGRGHSRREGRKAVRRLREHPEVNFVACRRQAGCHQAVLQEEVQGAQGQQGRRQAMKVAVERRDVGVRPIGHVPGIGADEPLVGVYPPARGLPAEVVGTELEDGPDERLGPGPGPAAGAASSWPGWLPPTRHQS